MFQESLVLPMCVSDMFDIPGRSTNSLGHHHFIVKVNGVALTFLVKYIGSSVFALTPLIDTLGVPLRK